MAYVTIAARLPEKDQKELEYVMKVEDLDKSAAARKMIEKGIGEWKKDEALKKLAQGKYSLSAAAEMAGISVWEMADLVKARKVHFIRISDEELKKEIEGLSQ